MRLEGEAIQADHAWGVVAERILERLGATPSMPDPPAEIGPETEDKARRKLERLQREREEMGPVNLRAEVEAEEVGKQIDTIVRERDELTTAIAKLRGSIGHLNREGRERLSDRVRGRSTQHFQALFTRMFGGGRAHLALVGSDDPLEAGLEIYAQPPGKKLATLSLLSGGEQALTALSLIFAVFRCNPAPVCVLDEVDAPLDDANVERFCMLLEDMVRETGTRFLVVTHHHADHGADGPVVWRDHAGARGVAAAVGRSSARGRVGGPRTHGGRIAGARPSFSAAAAPADRRAPARCGSPRPAASPAACCVHRRP